MSKVWPCVCVGGGCVCPHACPPQAAHARLPHVVPFHFAAAAGGHDAYDQAPPWGSRVPSPPPSPAASASSFLLRPAEAPPDGRYRLSGGYPKWRLDSQIAGEWRALYEFTASPLGNDDLVAMNDYAMQRHRDNLMAARIEGAKRHALRNNRLNTHENGETTTRMPILPMPQS